MSFFDDSIKKFEKDISSSFGPKKFNGKIPLIPVLKSDSLSMKRDLQKGNREIQRLFGSQRPGTWFKGLHLLKPLPSDSATTVQLIRKYNQKARTFNTLGGNLMKKVQAAMDAEASQHSSRPSNFAPNPDALSTILATLHLIENLCCEKKRLNEQQSTQVISSLDPVIHMQLQKMRQLKSGQDGITTLNTAIIQAHSRKKLPGKSKNLASTQPDSQTWDPVTNRRIAQLDVRVRKPAIEFINTCESKLAIKLRVSQGLRTMAEQNKLHAQGRTTPGKIVTNAKGGDSYHNYGLAIDVVEILNGNANYNPDWETISKIGIGLGFEWGGNFKKFIDKPHFQMSFGQSINQLKLSNPK